MVPTSTSEVSSSNSSKHLNAIETFDEISNFDEGCEFFQTENSVSPTFENVPWDALVGLEESDLREIMEDQMEDSPCKIPLSKQPCQAKKVDHEISRFDTRAIVPDASDLAFFGLGASPDSSVCSSDVQGPSADECFACVVLTPYVCLACRVPDAVPGPSPAALPVKPFKTKAAALRPMLAAPRPRSPSPAQTESAPRGRRPPAPKRARLASATARESKESIKNYASTKAAEAEPARADSSRGAEVHRVMEKQRRAALRESMDRLREALSLAKETVEVGVLSEALACIRRLEAEGAVLEQQTSALREMRALVEQA
jgi:hypothetical protein